METKMKPTKNIFGKDDSVPVLGTDDIFGYKQGNSTAEHSNVYGYTPEELESFKGHADEKKLEGKAAAEIISSQPKVIDFGDYIRLENITCVDADGNIFERYPELYIRKDIFRINSSIQPINYTPYRHMVLG